MADIRRYGQEGELQGDYYTVQVDQGGPYPGAAKVAVFYFIDGLGNTTKISNARPDAFSAEVIEELPTLGEAVAMHLGEAFNRAEANQKKWERQRKDERERPTPAPQPVDAATERFLSDGAEQDLSADPLGGWRP